MKGGEDRGQYPAILEVSSERESMELNLRSFDKQKQWPVNDPQIQKAIETGRSLLRNRLIEYWNGKDIVGVLAMLGNSYAMAFVFDNIDILKSKGLYEKALLMAYQGINTNNSNWSPNVIDWLLRMADSDRLKAAGDKFPDKKSFTLYRGVAGNGKARRVSGHSWTEDISVAAWFAKRFDYLNDPAVFQITVSSSDILARLSNRNESEYLLALPLPTKPKRIPSKQMETAYQAYMEYTASTIH